VLLVPEPVLGLPQESCLWSVCLSFGAYEFALPDTFDSMLYDAMSHCVEYEKDDKKSFAFNPIING